MFKGTIYSNVIPAHPRSGKSRLQKRRGRTSKKHPYNLRNRQPKKLNLQRDGFRFHEKKNNESQIPKTSSNTLGMSHKEMVICVNRKLKELYEKGIEERNMGNYSESILNFEEIIEIAPSNITGYNSRGYTYLVEKDYKNAIIDFNFCVKLDPNNNTVLLNRGKTLIHLKKVKEAFMNYNHMIRISPNDSRGWNGRGVCLKKMGHPRQALKCFNKAIGMNAKYAKEPLINKSFTHWTVDEFIPAIIGFSTLIKKYNIDISLYRDMRSRNVDELKEMIFFDGKKNHSFWGLVK